MASSPVSTFKILQMTVLSFAVLAVGIGIALAFNG